MGVTFAADADAAGAIKGMSISANAALKSIKKSLLSLVCMFAPYPEGVPPPFCVLFSGSAFSALKIKETRLITVLQYGDNWNIGK
jgi:hypothetical protein